MGPVVVDGQFQAGVADKNDLDGGLRSKVNMKILKKVIFVGFVVCSNVKNYRNGL